MITVIGGSGFIGSYLCELLSQKNISFEIIDLKCSKRFPNNTKIGDVRDMASIRKIISGDTIINLAAVHRDDIVNKDDYYETNVRGAENIIQICKEKGIRKILFTSSVAVYGFSKKNTSEDGEILPFNEYGKTKYLAEQKFQKWQRTEPHYRSLKIIRPTVIFGPGNRGNVYNLFLQIARKRFIMVGNGKNLKSMAYVENVASFIIYILKQNEKNFVINYIDKPDLDMNSLVKLVRIKLDQRNLNWLRVPYSIGLGLGVLADYMSHFLKRKLSISSIRVKKFCTTTTFSSTKKKSNFKSPFTLVEGIEKTIEYEFISPDPVKEVFFTE